MSSDLHDALDEIAENVDSLENLEAMLANKGCPAQLHVDCLRLLLPAITAKIKAACVRAGCDPWST